MRRACIDIGSNTTRLLVADWDGNRLTQVHQARAFTSIGPARLADGTIPAAKVAEVGEVVAQQLEAARRLGTESVRCVATASIRGASNPAELVGWVERRCPGLVVEILSGGEEARLAFLGASRTLPVPDGPLGVVDVGGGSSELVVGTVEGGVSWWASMPLGSGELTAAFFRGDPPTPGELAAAQTHVEEVLVEAGPPEVSCAVAVGGSATSMLSLGSAVLDADAFSRSLQLLAGGSSGDVARESGLDVKRVRLLPAGLLILQAASARFGRPLQVGRGGLREGVLLDTA